MLTGVKAKYQLNDIVRAKLILNTRLWKTPKVSHTLILKQANGTDDELRINLPFVTLFSIEKRINELVKHANL